VYAQVSRVQLQQGKAEEWIALTRDSILPAAREEKGFVTAYLLVDREANTGIGISLWETEDDVVAVATSGFYQQQAAKAAPLLAGSPERQVYEVALQP
jgi:heme-degrading monooxygenase HmoA